MANGNNGNNGNEKHPLGTFFQLVFVIVVAMVAWEITTEGSYLAAWFAKHVMGLFERSTINPNDTRGFAKFVQLILIAVFIGWAARRFRKK
jgi:hypothetical protein